jgi:signal transduction histidine kinase
MQRFSLSGLRSRAILLVLLAILPLFGLTLYSYVESRAKAIREAQRDEVVAARNLANTMEILIRNTQQLLISLSQLPQVQQRDRDGCNPRFARVLEHTPYYAVLVGADPDGQVFASAPKAQVSINVADRLWFKKAKEMRGFFVGEPLLGRISGKYSLNMSYPIFDNLGSFQGALVASIDLGWLGGLLAKSDLPPSTALVLTDATRMVLFRYPEPLKYVGKRLPEPLIQVMATKAEGTAHGVGLPEDERLFAFARLSPPWQGYYVAIGLPLDYVLRPVNLNLRQNLMYLGLVGLFALVAAWYGSGFIILRPIRRLRAVTERLAAGHLQERIGPNYSVGELGLLAQAFDQMAAALEDRDSQLQETARELRQRVAELHRRTSELEAANQELEGFSYSVSHDLKSPLRGLAGFSRILLDDYGDRLDQEGKRYLDILQREARRMGQLIDDILALSRLGRLEMHFSSFEMTELCQEVFKELRPLEPDRELRLELGPLPAAYGDRELLRQVMVNLLGNAIKFTRHCEISVIEVSGRIEDNETIYCVRDNGVGFDMTYVQKLFGVFQRLHTEDQFEGTGVGLAIVQRAVQRHGGRVWAEGKEDEGAVVCFTLPVKSD